MKMPTIKELFSAGAHFGHQKYRSAAQARPYVFAVRDGVMIFDLEKTAQALKRASGYLRSELAKGSQVLVVGTKRQLRDLTSGFAQGLQLPYVAHRWPGGMLTNFDTVKRRIARYNELVSQTEGTGGKELTKKEQRVIAKQVEKMGKLFEGIRTLDKLPDSLLIVSATADTTAVTEARKLGLPTVAITDTDTNPELVSMPIPANDDSLSSVELILKVLEQAIREGQQQRKAQKVTASKHDRERQKTAG